VEFDDGYGDPSDYGMTARDFDDATQAGYNVSGVTSSDFNTGGSEEDYNSVALDQDPVQVAQTMAGGPRGYANFIVDQVGDRSNIRNAVNYDPLYAQALNISRGYLPNNQVIGFYPTANKFQGQQDLTIPMDMRPTISGEAGKFGPQYHSGFEKFLQEDATNLANTIGIGPLINTLKGYGGNIKDKFLSSANMAGEAIKKDFSNLTDSASNALDYILNPAGGTETTEEVSVVPQVQELAPGEFEFDYIPGSMPERNLNTGIVGLDEPAYVEATDSMPGKLTSDEFEFDYGYVPQITDENKINEPQMTDIERYIEESVRNMSPEIKASMPSDLTAYFEQRLSPSLPIPTNENRERRDFMRDLLAYQAKQKREQERLNRPVRSSALQPMPAGMTVGDLERMERRIPIS